MSSSADASTLAVGGWARADEFLGATWVFTQWAGVWSQQGAKLVRTGGTGQQLQARSVSLSADGSVLAVGGSGAALSSDRRSSAGTWVFQRSSAGICAQQGTVLAGTLSSNSFSEPIYPVVALSASAAALVVGLSDGAFGGAWVFEAAGVSLASPSLR